MNCYRHAVLLFCLWICSAHLYLYVGSVLYILIGIKLLSLPILTTFCSFVLSFATIADLMLWKLKIVLSYCIKLLCIHLLFFLILVHVVSCSASFVIFWHLLALASTYSLEVVHFTISWTALAIGRVPPWFMGSPVVFVVVMCSPLLAFAF